MMFYKNVPFLALQKVLLITLPVSLIFSIFIADLIVSLLFLFFVYYLFNYKNYLILNNLYFKLFFSYWIYMNIISFFSNDILISLKSSFFYLRFITLPLTILIIINIDNKIQKYFFWILGLIIIVLSLDALFQFLTGQNILGYDTIDNRISSFFGKEKILGSYLARIFFVFAGMWFFYFKTNNLKLNFYFLFFLILCSTTILISGDRMPFILFLFCLFILFFSFNFDLKWKFIYSIILLIFLTLPILLSQNIYDRVVKRTLYDFGSEKGLSANSRLYKIELENKKTISFLSQHQNFFYTSIKMIRDKPIFGHSNRGYKINCTKYALDLLSCPSHPHNNYLQIFVENGLIGFTYLFSIFTYFSVILLKNIFNIKKKENLNLSEICYILAIYLNLWPIAQTGNLYNNWLSILYFIPVAFVLNKSYKINKLVS